MNDLEWKVQKGHAVNREGSFKYGLRESASDQAHKIASVPYLNN